MKAKKQGRQSAATYAVMTVCLLAAALGAWGASRNGRDTGNLTETVSISYAPSVNLPTENVEADIPVTGVPYSEPETVTEDVTEIEKEYVLPLGSFITKDYSAGTVVYSNTMRDWRVHNGIDFGDNRGQSVLAIADGTVQEVREDVLWGTVLTIEHPNGLTAKYCGLEKGSTPPVGETVEKGVIVGKLGEIPVESKDGPHLHLEITVNGTLTDPLRILKP